MRASCGVRTERARECWACARISRRDARAAGTGKPWSLLGVGEGSWTRTLPATTSQCDDGAPKEAAGHVPQRNLLTSPARQEPLRTPPLTLPGRPRRQLQLTRKGRWRSCMWNSPVCPCDHCQSRALRSSWAGDYLRGHYSNLVPDGSGPMPRLQGACRASVARGHSSMATPQSIGVSAAASHSRLGEQSEDASERPATGRLRPWRPPRVNCAAAVPPAPRHGASSGSASLSACQSGDVHSRAWTPRTSSTRRIWSEIVPVREVLVTALRAGSCWSD